MKTAYEKRMTKYKNELLTYAREMIAKYGVEKAVMPIWNAKGYPVEAKDGALVVWFGRERLEIR